VVQAAVMTCGSWFISGCFHVYSLFIVFQLGIVSVFSIRF